ncbi:MAG: hypothetical protein CMF62_03280 [Magnetococcales bacterium]|nr:hypothetical protein [Magnetococcales bacterium]|tara:strand:- start:1152 stop:1448 length:297 start_codon:yes stop_codon:yes gene_type:complete
MASSVKFELVECNFTGVYKLKATNQKCGICNNDILDQSIEDKNKKDSNSKVVIGNCEHAFFESCMKRWLKDHTMCPICNVPWKQKDSAFNVNIFNQEF